MKAYTVTALFTGLLGHVSAQLSAPDSASKPLRLWEKKSGAGGQTYADFYPVGNGRIGAQFNGGPDSESYRVNENSFWSGSFIERTNPDAKETVKDMQKMVANGDYYEAQEAGRLGYAGTSVSTRMYNTLGSFYITQTLPSTNTSDYGRWLDIEESVGGVHFVSDGITFQREVIASYPDDIIAVHLKASKAGAIKFRARLDRGAWDVISLNRHVEYSQPANGDSVVMGGSTEDSNPIEWAAGIRVVAKGGKVKTIGDNVNCEGADEAILYFQAWTNYRKKNPKKAVLSDLKSKGNDFEKLRKAHVADYQRYFKRTSVKFGESTDEQKAMTIPERMSAVDTGKFDPGLTELIFQLGRYMLISSSRPGEKSLPPGLQGIWNDVLDPPWGGKYTLNINLQMNYWPSLTLGLSDLVEPLNNLLSTMTEKGRKVAKEMYGAKGTVTHHNTDMWGDSAPQDNYFAATFWNMGGAWMATHLIEHYRFTGDKKLLKKMFPVLKANTEFILDFLTEHEGYLVTNPSSSPENTFVDPAGTDRSIAITLGPTVDNAVIRELLDFMPDAHSALGIKDKKFLQKVNEIKAQLPPLRINQYGGLAEWFYDYEENNPGQGHVSHMVTQYPFNHITSANATLSNATATTLERRLENGGGDCGWPRVWTIALAGRMFLPDVQDSRMMTTMNECSYNRTLLNIGGTAPFQADANYGIPAAMIEAFIQSHEVVRYNDDGDLVSAKNTDSDKLHLIRLLPSIPENWISRGGGNFKGVSARGGFTVSASWDNKGNLRTSSIRSELGNEAVVTIGKTIVGTDSGAKLRVTGKSAARFIKISGKKGTETEVEGE